MPKRLFIRVRARKGQITAISRTIVVVVTIQLEVIVNNVHNG